MQILNFFFAQLTCAINRNLRHGAGAIQSNEGNQIIEAVNFRKACGITHSRTFQLEHANGFASRQHFKRLGIVEQNLLNIKVRRPGTNEFLRLVDDRECFETEKVELY